MLLPVCRFLETGGVELVDLREDFGDCTQLYGAAYPAATCLPRPTTRVPPPTTPLPPATPVTGADLGSSFDRRFVWRFVPHCATPNQASRNMQRATCNMQQAGTACNVQYATCNRFDPRYFELGFFAAKFRRL